MTNLDEKRDTAKNYLNCAVAFLRDARHMLGLVLEEARQALENDEDAVIVEAMTEIELEEEMINYRGGLWRLNHDGRCGEA